MRSQKNSRLPKISFIIPVKPDGEINEAVAALKKINYPLDKYEVLVVYGQAPSKQRNEASRRARGEILYFLDNDAQIQRQSARKVVAAFTGRYDASEYNGRGFSVFPKAVSRLIIDWFFSGQIYSGKIGAVGGPNIWIGKENFWSKMSGVVLESFFTHFLMAARYRQIGATRRSSEKQLILCNLAIDKKAFQSAGGFNQMLYPNEENELLNRLDKSGYQLIYRPDMLVFRPRRQTLAGLLKAFFNYGRGRMEQIRIEGLWPSWLIFLPLLFCFYLLLLIFYRPNWFLVPLILYGIMALVSALGFAVRKNSWFMVAFLPFLFALVHFTYGFGSIYGWFTDLNERKNTNQRKRVVIKCLKSFNGSWLI